MNRGKTKELRPSLKCPIQLGELMTLRIGSSDKDSMYVIKSVQQLSINTLHELSALLSIF